MEGLSLGVGIAMMFVAAIGIFLYAALVITILVCRLLDWLFEHDPDELSRRRAQHAQSSRRGVHRLGIIATHVLQHRRPWIRRK
jgi:hypothetical protein